MKVVTGGMQEGKKEGRNRGDGFLCVRLILAF